MFWFFSNVGAYHISSTHTRHNWSLRLSVGGVALLPTYLGLPSSHLSTVKLTQCVCVCGLLVTLKGGHYSLTLSGDSSLQHLATSLRRKTAK